jgi:endonuclease/exonuclease/phosphatase family metal-dependent hydrolase
VVKEEFDFESPVNDDGNGSGITGADHDGRLTMRDVIIARVGKRVKTSNPTSGTFNSLLKVTPAGQNINVTRGWTAVDAKIGKRAKPFRFVNLHFEAFDSSGANQTSQGTTVGKGQVRQAQAQQLTGPGGPAAKGKLPVILVGDLNSDDNTVAQNGDHLAYGAIVANGFRPVDTSNPMSCCLNDPELVGGAITDFDHHIDHVMTNSKRIKFVRGFVTGLNKVSGLQPSDHAGVTSELRVPAKKAKKKKRKNKK